MANNQNTYDNRIVFLRALSIGAVLIYHWKISLFDQIIFSGGFLGVDIFFIISGFLMTKIILKLKKDNKLTFKSYIYKRSRRIIPSLLLILFFIQIIFLIILTPDKLIIFSESIISSVTFISNLFFYKNNFVYGTSPNSLNPLIHTWSISLEIQYYILIFLFFYFFSTRRIFWFFLLSLIICEILSHYNRTLNFYIVFSRLWEFLIGSFLYLNLIKLKKFKNEYLNFSIAIVGLLIIIFSFIFFDNTFRLPSFMTILLIVGVVVFFEYSINSPLLIRLISFKWIFYLALISYSLYLWHQPILVLNRLIGFTSGNILSHVFLLLLILLISTLNTLLFENKLRDEKKFSNYYFINLILILFFLNISLSILTIEKKGFPQRLPQILKGYMIEQQFDKELNINNLSYNTIITVGDSQIRDIEYDLFSYLKNKKNYNFHSLTKNGCEFLINVNKIDPVSNKISKCDIQMQNERLSKIEKYQDATIIMGGRSTLYLTSETFDNNEGGVENEQKTFVYKDKNQSLVSYEKAFTETVKYFLDKNYKIVLIYPVPETGWSIPQEVLKRFFSKKLNKDDFVNSLNDNPITTSFDLFIKRNKKTFELYDSIQHPNINRIYPHKIFCNNQIKSRCITHTNDQLLYYDAVHLSSHGIKILVKELIKLFN